MIKYAINSGNWEDSTIWNDGIIPNQDDEVYANGFVITLRSVTVITAAKISTEICPDTGIGAGVFRARDGMRVNVPVIQAGLSSCIDALTGPLNFTITGNLYGSKTGYFHGLSVTTAIDTQISANIIGDVAGYNGYGIFFQSGYITNLVDYRLMINGTLNSYGLFVSGNGIRFYYTHIGNIRAGDYYCLKMSESENLEQCIIAGNIYASPDYPAFILITSRTIIEVTGSLYNNSYQQAIVVSKLALDTLDNIAVVVQNSSGNDVNLITSLTDVDIPNPNDVRKGVVYGIAGSEKEGNIIIPDASLVSKGVMFDIGSVGMAEINSNDIAKSLISELLHTTWAKRLNDVATVQLLGVFLRDYKFE